MGLLEQLEQQAFSSEFLPSLALILKDDKKFIIAGYSSVDIKDSDGEKVNLSALRVAFDTLMKKQSRRNLMLSHSNIQIGELLESHRDSAGKLWKSGVDDNGLFIVAELFNDTRTGNEMITHMRNGRLMNFSIGGRTLDREMKCDDYSCWSEIMNLELFEITSCDKGKNPEAKAFILKADNTDELWDLKSGKSLIKKLPITDIPVIKMEGEEERTLKQSIDGLTAIINDLRDDMKAEKKPKEYYYYQKPKKEEFKRSEDYASALETFSSDEAEKARKKKKEEEDEEEDEVTKSMIDLLTEDLDDVEKASYRECMSTQMKAGKSMAEAAKVCKPKVKKAEGPESCAADEEWDAEKKVCVKKPAEKSADEVAKAAMRAEIIKELGLPPEGDPVNKGQVPDPKKGANPLDIAGLIKKSADVNSLTEFLEGD
uniref:Putative prohead protease n=1 Tax=viral metagenome TaxID=1070528 RepID=A0A6M3JB58_9ZZZZ